MPSRSMRITVEVIEWLYGTTLPSLSTLLP